MAIIVRLSLSVNVDVWNVSLALILHALGSLSIELTTNND